MLNRWLIIAMFVNAFVCDESHTDSQLAAKHLARVLQTAKCDQPMPRVVYLSKHLSKYNKKYKPFATVLYVCDSGSGCCNDETQRCVAKNIETIVLHFLALEVTVEGNKKSVEAITFRNHTKCECRHINSDETKDEILEEYPKQTNISFLSVSGQTAPQDTNQSNSVTIYHLSHLICILFMLFILKAQF